MVNVRVAYWEKIGEVRLASVSTRRAYTYISSSAAESFAFYTRASDEKNEKKLSDENAKLPKS